MQQNINLIDLVLRCQQIQMQCKENFCSKLQISDSHIFNNEDEVEDFIRTSSWPFSFYLVMWICKSTDVVFSRLINWNVS